ncbi:hypothetical protein FD754_015767 [Muntiacus muntjak]|uniref:G-protein coupled receptors family 1 profile domain-containing protein n=1 Tax=Muntiacus muntjak TaxID=9888 RepID=A0A5N3VNJ9_MUNMU|nr:hypothetical protein FD754_015767 [Muntiacus muntjak]
MFKSEELRFFFVFNILRKSVNLIKWNDSCWQRKITIQRMDLNYNNLGEFPQAIKALPSLKELLFHSNSISVIPDGAFDGNPLLKTIFSVEVLVNTWKLCFFGYFYRHLYDNPLSFVGNSAFHNLSELHSFMACMPSLHGEYMEKQWKQRETLFWGAPKITADGDCIHEIKICLLLGRKAMINLDSILKSRDITFYIDRNRHQVGSSVTRETSRGARPSLSQLFHHNLSKSPNLSWIGNQRSIGAFQNLEAALKIKSTEVSYIPCLHMYMAYPEQTVSLPSCNTEDTIHLIRKHFFFNIEKNWKDLSRNLIHEIDDRAFAKLGSITNLDVSFNELTSFPTEGLNGLNQLKLVGNFKLKEALAAKDFVNLRSLSVPYAYQCCAFWGCDSYAHSNTEDNSLQDHSGSKDKGLSDVAGVTSSAENEEHSQVIIHCTPSTGAFKPCEYLLGSWMIRLTVWFIFLVALFFNLLVILTTFASCTSVPSSKLFIGLISVSNLFMGAYTGILTFLDAVSWGRFAEFGIWWEIGSGCKIAGFLAVFSSESAIFLLMLAAIERSLSAKDMMKSGKSNHLKEFRIAALLAFLGAAVAGCFPLFHRGEYSASPLCLPFPTGETPSLGFTVTLVLLNSLAFLLMAIIYTKLYCNLEKEDLSENSHSSMIKHVAWLIFTNCIFFCPVAFFSFAPLITAISISPEIMKSVTLIFFPLPACLNPVLYVFFNPKFKEDWKLLKRHVARRSGSASLSIGSQAGCAEQDFYYDCSMYSHLQGNLAVCDCCEAFLLTKPVSCKHLVKSHSCPALTVGSCQRPDGYWSDCGTQSAHSDYADEEDSFVSDSSDQVQACGRACFYQSRGFPLVRYAYNLPRVKD